MNRRNLALGAVGIVALLAAWYVLLWSPKSADLSKAKQDRAAAEAATDAAKFKLAQLQAASANRSQLEATSSRLVLAVPVESDLAPLIREVNGAAAAAGLAFVSVQPTPPVASTIGGPSEIALSVQLQGGYGPVLDFLDRLMAFNRLVVIDGVSITPTSSTNGSGTLAMSFTARTFTTELVTSATPASAAASTATSATATSGTAR